MGIVDTYVLLVDVGCDWPEVVLADSFEHLDELAKQLPEGTSHSRQCIVSIEDAVDEITTDPEDQD